MFLLLFFFLAAVFIHLFKNFQRPKNFPPGPEGLRFLGNSSLIKKLAREKGGLHLAFSHLAKQFDTSVLSLQLGTELVVVVFSEDDIAQVHLSDEFLGRPDNFFTRLRTMGVRRGITITDGRLWQEQHKFAMQHLHQLGFGKVVMKSLIKNELNHFVDFLKKEKGSICITNYLAPLVLNVLWTIVAGSRFELDDPGLKELLDLFNTRSKVFDISGGTLNQFPWLRLIAPEKSGYNLIKSLNAQLHSLIANEIKKHKQARSAEVRDFIDLYLAKIEGQDTEKDIFNEEQLLAVCLDFIIAGSTTTSNTLGFALLAMIRYPEVQTKVQETLDAAGFSDSQSDSKGDKLNYVTAVILESMRCSHVVPVAGPRRVLKDTVIAGYDIPKDTIVLMAVHAILQSKERWGDPEVFRPERFLDSKGDLINTDRLYFYGRGKRRCIGEALARNFIFQFFTGLLYHFKLTLAPNTSLPTTPVQGITLSLEPFFITVTPRNIATNL